MKKWLVIVFCFTCLMSCTKVDDNDRIKEIDFSALELDTPDSRVPIKNIVKKLKKRHHTENNLFVADCMTIELPESFHAEFLTHWEMGDLYYSVKNPKDTVFMFFDFGLRSKSGHSHDFDVNTLEVTGPKQDPISDNDICKALKIEQKKEEPERVTDSERSDESLSSTIGPGWNGETISY